MSDVEENDGNDLGAGNEGEVQPQWNQLGVGVNEGGIGEEVPGLVPDLFEVVEEEDLIVEWLMGGVDFEDFLLLENEIGGVEVPAQQEVVVQLPNADVPDIADEWANQVNVHHDGWDPFLQNLMEDEDAVQDEVEDQEPFPLWMEQPFLDGLVVVDEEAAEEEIQD